MVSGLRGLGMVLSLALLAGCTSKEEMAHRADRERLSGELAQREQERDQYKTQLEQAQADLEKVRQESQQTAAALAEAQGQLKKANPDYSPTLASSRRRAMLWC